MDKMNQKRTNKHSKTKKIKQPLKVVYIANPMRFKTSVSEFRALVQELTGQDAPETAVGGGGEVAEGTNRGQSMNGEVVDRGSGFGSGNDYLSGLVGSDILDVLDAM